MGRLPGLALVIALSSVATPQTVSLKISVTVTAADGSPRPVPGHALLISDDPVTTAPHRFVTKRDGSAEAYILYLNSTPEANTPERDEAKKFLHEQFNMVWPEKSA